MLNVSSATERLSNDVVRIDLFILVCVGMRYKDDLLLRRYMSQGRNIVRRV